MTRDRRASSATTTGKVRPGARATDDVAGLGRVEQLVLRGDGLTTTSLQILTGELITVIVDAHWSISVPGPQQHLPTSVMTYGGDGPDTDAYLAVAHQFLDARSGETLLIREVLLVGTSGTVYGAAEVVARLSELPASVASALASSEHPIGRLLRDNNVIVTRELVSWGRIPAGPRADRLDPRLVQSSRVAGRTYVMRMAGTGTVLAVLTERFGANVFTAE